MFRIQDHKNSFDILWVMLGNGSECILNCVLWFVSVILNFNVLCDEYTVQRQCYSKVEYFA